MLTERKFQELYQEALKARAIGHHAAARDRLLYLFDHGRTVGGFGVTRLSFVLRELSELAEPESRTRGREAQQTLASLQQRRDRREAQVRQGQAGFIEIQELLALNRALAQPRRSLELYRELESAENPSPDLVAERQTFSDLLPEEIPLAADAEAILIQYRLERLKRDLLDLQREVDGRLAAGPPADGDDGGSTAVLRGRLDPVRDLVSRPGEDDKACLAALARDSWELLSRYPMPPSAGDPRTVLEKLSKGLARLIDHYKILEDRLRDDAILAQVDRLARGVATLICEQRVDQDFPDPELALPEGYRSALEGRVRNEGLVAYEVLLRSGQDAKAATLESWLLSFCADREMYEGLLAAARRTGTESVQGHLTYEAGRLEI